MATVRNAYGRPWEELDALRACVQTEGAFALVAEDGTPLVGRHIDGQAPARLIAQGWRVDVPHA